MYFNYKNIDDNIKISLMAMEGYISLNRIKDLYNDDLDIQIIYNTKFSSTKEKEKTDVILKLEKIINIIVNFELKNNKSLEQINSFLNKVSAENIEKVIIKG